jgi:hypothetical protein
MVEEDSGVWLNKVGGLLGIPSPRFTVLAGRRLAREREMIRSQPVFSRIYSITETKRESRKV